MAISEGVDKDSNPYIEIDKHRFFKVGCKDCGTGGRFSLCWDGGYPKSEIDFNKNPRFNNKRFWKYGDIERFRKMCRKWNQLIRFQIDPEV